MGKYLDALRGYIQLVLPTSRSDGPSEAEPTLADTFKHPVSALSNRANALRRIALVASLLAIVAGAIATLCSLGGWLSLPSDALHVIDIPKHVVELFEPVRHSISNSNGIDAGLPSLTSSITDLFGFVRPIFMALGGLMLVFGIFQLIANGSFVGIPPALMLIVAPNFLGAFIDTDSSSQRESHQEFNAITVAAKSKDYVTLKRLLNSDERVDGFSKAYVLAQAAILAHVKEPAALEEATKGLRSEELAALSRNLSPGKPAFTIDPQVAYSIEKATDGMVLNLAASRYEDDALQTVRTWRGVGWFATLVCVFFGVVAVGPLLLSRLISSRLKRLDVLFRQADTQ